MHTQLFSLLLAVTPAASNVDDRPHLPPDPSSITTEYKYYDPDELSYSRVRWREIIIRVVGSGEERGRIPGPDSGEGKRPGDTERVPRH